MAGNQLAGDAFIANMAGMTQSQLYDIMSQMKMLVEQNHNQARQILIQNPQLTKTLFKETASPIPALIPLSCHVDTGTLAEMKGRGNISFKQLYTDGDDIIVDINRDYKQSYAQIILGMVQPPQAVPNIQTATAQLPQQAAQPVQQPNVQSNHSLQVQSSSQDPINAPQSQNAIRNNQQQNQTLMQSPPTSIPLDQSSQSHPMQTQQPHRGHHNAQATPMSLPQSSQVPNMTPLPLHSAPQPPPLLQPPMQGVSTQLQQPMQTTGIPHMPLQPPLPPQPRPPSVQTFPHQHYSHMGPNVGFQHPGAPPLHHSQPMFHSKPPGGMGPPFSQGQPPLPNQPPPQPMYQGGGSHLGMEFNQMGSSTQAERGPAWMPGPPENTTGTQLPGAPSPFAPGQMSSGGQPSRASLSPDMEKALLQQVMSLTPEQINLLPPEQRNQVLQLQQMLRQ